MDVLTDFLLYICYMTTIPGMMNKVNKIDLRTATEDIIVKQSADIILLNQLQLLEGLDSRGRQFKDYESDKYAIKKHDRNPLPEFGVPDLRDTGEFYQDFTLSVDNGYFDIDSSDFKSTELKKHYGDELFGLSKEHKKEYALGEFKTSIQNYVTKTTGLKFGS